MKNRPQKRADQGIFIDTKIYIYFVQTASAERVLRDSRPERHIEQLFWADLGLKPSARLGCRRMTRVVEKGNYCHVVGVGMDVASVA
jgi:hypothetical protein